MQKTTLNQNQQQKKQQSKSQKLKVSSLGGFNQQSNRIQSPFLQRQYINCQQSDGVYKCHICQNLKKKKCPYSANLSNSHICKNVSNSNLSDMKFAKSTEIYRSNGNTMSYSMPKPVFVVQNAPVKYMIEQHIMYPVYHNIYYPSVLKNRGTSSNPQSKRKNVQSSAKKQRLEQSTLLLSQRRNQPIPPQQLRKLAKSRLLNKR